MDTEDRGHTCSGLYLLRFPELFSEGSNSPRLSAGKVSFLGHLLLGTSEVATSTLQPYLLSSMKQIRADRKMCLQDARSLYASFLLHLA